MLVSMCACASPASTEDAYQAKVALCLVTPVNDGAWSQLAYDAVMKAKDTYNISVNIRKTSSLPRWKQFSRTTHLRDMT